MININELKFDKNGLIPAIVVDNLTKKVLTLAYMNEESLKISLEKGLTCFYSRSRQELWLKGETSGNYQHIVSITADCDKDALVVVVEPDGPACHLGTKSCFENRLWESEELKEFSLQSLMMARTYCGGYSFSCIPLSFSMFLTTVFWSAVSYITKLSLYPASSACT